MLIRDQKEFLKGMRDHKEGVLRTPIEEGSDYIAGWEYEHARLRKEILERHPEYAHLTDNS